MAKVRILSIDGGGIRGILPGMIIASLEHRIQRITRDPAARIMDFIDFVAGTSTGGIIASALLLPGFIPGRQHYTANEVVDFYFKHGPKIFKRNLWDKVRTLGGLRDQKYSNDYLVSALNDQFGEVALRDLIRPCIITGYDITARRSRFFGKHKAMFDAAENFLVKNVALATASAPTYFEPANIFNMKNEPFPMVDGGVFANNPALCAYAEARKLDFAGLSNHPFNDNPTYFAKPTAKDMLLLSLGTGSVKKSYPYSQAKKWGAINWIRPTIDIMMSGNSETVTHQLRQIFDAADNPDGFIRLEPELRQANSAMDDASSENLENLKYDALSYMYENNNAIELIAHQLVNES